MIIISKRPFRRKHVRPHGPEQRRPPGPSAPDSAWIYGAHAALAALANPRRRIRRILVGDEAAERHGEAIARARTGRPPESPLPETTPVAIADLVRFLPPDAVHQGIAVEADPLPEVSIEALCRDVPDRAVVVVLDKVTDPQNVGAVLRSAAAFGALAVIVPDRGSPEATPALVKAASGAIERVPLVRATNLRRALETLKAAGYWCYGFDADADVTLGAGDIAARAALVLGAEGEGLRPLTRETCDLLLRVPISAAVESLNVSAAAAVALYEHARRHGDGA